MNQSLSLCFWLAETALSAVVVTGSAVASGAAVLGAARTSFCRVTLGGRRAADDFPSVL